MPREAQGAIKLQSPLYCAVWLKNYCIVAGGGGRASSGIPNRLWCLPNSGSQFGEAAAILDLEDAPLRLALAPDHTNLVLAVGATGLVKVALHISGKGAVDLHIEDRPETFREVGQARCLCFSKNGRLLTVGADDGSLSVLNWPSGSLRRRLKTKPLRDADFSSAHGNKVLGAAYEDGSCVLWEWESETQLVSLVPPADLRRGAFSRIRFAPDGGPAFFTVVNAAGAGHVLLWRQDAAGEVRMRRQCRVAGSAITAFDVSPSGTYFGTGTSEGEVAIFATRTMALLRRINQAHMVFATSVAFSSEEKGLLSVSADASARTSLLRPDQRSTKQTLFGLALLTVIVAILVSLCVRTFRQ